MSERSDRDANEKCEWIASTSASEFVRGSVMISMQNSELRNRASVDQRKRRKKEREREKDNVRHGERKKTNERGSASATCRTGKIKHRTCKNEKWQQQRKTYGRGRGRREKARETQDRGQGERAG